MKRIFRRLLNKNKLDEPTVPEGHPIFSNQLMAHALGGYEGKTYLNSKEAFNASLANGFRYFEVDLSLTTDGRLVVCHGWSKKNCKCLGVEYSDSFKKMTYEMICNMKIHGFDIMDAKEFYRLVKQHKDLYFELDFHNMGGQKAVKRIEALLEDFEYDQECLDRMLIQVYTKKMYMAIRDIYPFKYYQFLVGKNINKLDNIISYCKENNICAIALRHNLAKPVDVKKIKDAGLYCLCYSISNDVWATKKLLESGVDTICTDFITPAVLNSYEFNSKNPYMIYYNSGLPSANEAYSEEIKNDKLQGSVKTCKSGTVEFADKIVWSGNQKRALVANHFSVSGKKFLGWYLRVKVDGKNLWLCTDQYYHVKADFEEDPSLKCYLFSDEEELPVWVAAPNMKYVMVAVWEDVKNVENE